MPGLPTKPSLLRQSIQAGTMPDATSINSSEAPDPRGANEGRSAMQSTATPAVTSDVTAGNPSRNVPQALKQRPSILQALSSMRAPFLPATNGGSLLEDSNNWLMQGVAGAIKEHRWY